MPQYQNEMSSGFSSQFFSIESTCRLLETSPFIAVFFHDDDCAECEAILESLEQVPLSFNTV